MLKIGGLIMKYSNYEEYMRSVLGYSPYVDDYTYTDEQEDIYAYSNDVISMQPTQDLSAFYPEIYRIIYFLRFQIGVVLLPNSKCSSLLGVVCSETTPSFDSNH